MARRKISFQAGAAIALALTAGLATPLAAGVRDGVDAWSRGDYAAAVAEWQGPAAAGDADAMFNMAQAYRLGRGVAADQLRAEQLYLAAAQAGHVQAADTYGLMLFQDGRREQALPYVQAASDRGDPRAQYLLGVAHFNGDLVPRDWERAYALLTLANAAGLPQAAAAITQMDEHIPLEQRQSAAALARQLEDQAQAARAVQLAAADLGTGGEAMMAQAPVAAMPAPAAPPPPVTQRVPRAIPTVEVSPSVAAARDAVAQARQATGTEDPAAAGASYASAVGTPRPVAEPPAQVAAAPTPMPPAPRAVPAAESPAPSPNPAPQRASGPWRVQLGAFGVQGNAERLWTRLSGRPELAGRERLLVPAGRVTKLQAGGFASQAEAQAACTSLQRAGQECIVTRN